ncbi:hypothetical protein m07a_12730 [Bartonella schoenbuchensis m07a]|uniref:Uncharacterized protein n=1 Tax=Bartonella schoenbuchensis m07a TaxID=1094496 RepID=N6VBK5_9HYPH|nr:hypothetical protein m07a_12730 [Bartonella schoenbuchensis m07a]
MMMHVINASIMTTTPTVTTPTLYTTPHPIHHNHPTYRISHALSSARFHPMSMVSAYVDFHTPCIHPMHASPPIGTLEKPSLQHHQPQPLPHNTNRCTLRAKHNPDYEDASRVNINASTITGCFHDNRVLPT